MPPAPPALRGEDALLPELVHGPLVSWKRHATATLILPVVVLLLVDEEVIEPQG